jgi:hypothetical protein
MEPRPRRTAEAGRSGTCRAGMHGCWGQTAPAPAPDPRPRPRPCLEDRRGASRPCLEDNEDLAHTAPFQELPHWRRLSILFLLSVLPPHFTFSPSSPGTALLAQIRQSCHHHSSCRQDFSFYRSLPSSLQRRNSLRDGRHPLFLPHIYGDKGILVSSRVSAAVARGSSQLRLHIVVVVLLVTTYVAPTVSLQQYHIPSRISGVCHALHPLPFQIGPRNRKGRRQNSYVVPQP